MKIIRLVIFAAALGIAPAAAQQMNPSQIAVAVTGAISQLAQQADALQRENETLKVQVKNLNEQLETERKKHSAPAQPPK